MLTNTCRTAPGSAGVISADHILLRPLPLMISIRCGPGLSRTGEGCTVRTNLAHDLALSGFTLLARAALAGRRNEPGAQACAGLSSSGCRARVGWWLTVGRRTGSTRGPGGAVRRNGTGLRGSRLGVPAGR